MSIPYYHRTLVTFSRSKSIQSSNENMKNTFFAERIVGKDSSHHHHLSIVLNRWKVLLVRERQKERESQRKRGRERGHLAVSVWMYSFCVCLYSSVYIFVPLCMYSNVFSICLLCVRPFHVFHMYSGICLHWIQCDYCCTLYVHLALSDVVFVDFLRTYLLDVCLVGLRERECIAFLSLSLV